MRAVVQRVSSASVHVDGAEVSAIGKGALALVGVTAGDAEEDAEYVCRKLLNLRLWESAEGKPWSASLLSGQLDVLLVSQFTLFADLKANKPSFHRVMPPSEAGEFYARFVDRVRAAHAPGGQVRDGVFGAHMDVRLANDGPVTVIIDSKDR